MIKREDILSLAYLKKADFSGSYQGMRFRFHKGEKETEGEEGEGKEEAKAVQAVRQILEIVAWEAPYCFDVTPEAKKQKMEADFSEEGIRQGIDWLNGLWQAEPERWKAAKGNW